MSASGSNCEERPATKAFRWNWPRPSAVLA